MGLVGKPMELAKGKTPTAIHCRKKHDSLGLPTTFVSENRGRPPPLFSPQQPKCPPLCGWAATRLPLPAHVAYTPRPSIVLGEANRWPWPMQSKEMSP